MKILKTIVIVFAVLTTSVLRSQTYSNITYDAGTLIVIGTGADVCATSITINGTYSGGGSICTGALPVSLSSFTGTTDKRSVTLMWVTEWELNNFGFRIERMRIDENAWKEVSFVEGHGTSNTANGYIWKDEKLKAGTYKYRLKQIDYNGNFEYFSLESDVIVNPPGKFEMSQNYPNPSNPNCKINFEMPVNGKVSIVVYDLLGREVNTLLNENREADYYTIEFDGSNLASGVYFYRIYAQGEGQTFTKTMKMVLVK
ncbi:MAG: T9SS type A sorting domain-containing protein [Ignavibacteria bacterium]|nr:T9SS type A sorting domain-containing protein [Ignavibacteria bacterium]